MWSAVIYHEFPYRPNIPNLLIEVGARISESFEAPGSLAARAWHRLGLGHKNAPETHRNPRYYKHLQTQTAIAIVMHSIVHFISQHWIDLHFWYVCAHVCVCACVIIRAQMHVFIWCVHVWSAILNKLCLTLSHVIAVDSWSLKPPALESAGSWFSQWRPKGGNIQHDLIRSNLLVGGFTFQCFQLERLTFDIKKSMQRICRYLGPRGNPWSPVFVWIIS